MMQEIYINGIRVNPNDIFSNQQRREIIDVEYEDVTEETKAIKENNSEEDKIEDIEL